MAGFLRGLGQAIEGGIKGYDTSAQWEREAAAEKERKRLRDEDIEMKARLKSNETDDSPVWDHPNPTPATPSPSPADIAAGATQAAPPPAPAAIPVPAPAVAAAPAIIRPVPGRGYNQEDAIQELKMTAPEAAQFVSTGKDPRPDIPVAAPVGPPPIAQAALRSDVPAPATLPPTDTQRAAAAVAPPPQALQLPAKEVPAKDTVTVADRYTGETHTVPKSETRPMNDYERAVRRASIYRSYGKENEASSVLQQYVTQDAAKINQMGRDVEIAGMNYLLKDDHRGLDALSANNPIGVGFEMIKDDKGGVAFGLNPRGTAAPTAYLSADGHMSTTPVYMGVPEVMTLLRGAATGNMSGAVERIADFQSKFVTKAQGEQAIKASQAQVANAAVNTRIAARNAQTASDQALMEQGYQPNDPTTFNAGLGLPDTTPGEPPTQAIPGGTGGSAGSVGSAGSPPPSAYDTVIGYGKYGQPPKPLSTMTMGEVDTFGKNTLIPATRNKAELGLAGTGKGTSAAGAYQITGETMRDYAPKVLGANWRSQPFSVENQDKIGEAAFNANKGGNLQKIWASLPNSSPGAYKNRTWADMKGEIAQREVGRGLPTSAPPAATGTGLPQKAPLYAGGGQFDTPKKLEQEVVTARAQAQQTADATVAAARREAAANGTQLSDEGATALYRMAFNRAVTDRVGSYETRDKERLTDKLIPGAMVDWRGKPKGAYGGPNEAVRKVGNPFATGDLQKDKNLYQMVKKAEDQRSVSPAIREYINQFANLKKLDMAYARRIAAPSSSERVTLPAVSVSGQ